MITNIGSSCQIILTMNDEQHKKSDQFEGKILNSPAPPGQCQHMNFRGGTLRKAVEYDF